MEKISNQDLKILAEKYNSDGKHSLYTLLRTEYGIKNPTCTFKRMKSHLELEYCSETDRFSPAGNLSDGEDALFMSIDELCAPTPKTVERYSDKSIEMEKLIHELIGDRLLEISRYISIDSVSKTLVMDHASLTKDGYRVIVQK